MSGDPKDNDPLSTAKRIMGALGRMPPKPHKNMKLGKPRRKATKASIKGRTKKPAIGE